MRLHAHILLIEPHQRVNRLARDLLLGALLDAEHAASHLRQLSLLRLELELQNARLDARQRPRVVHSEERRQLVADLVRGPVVLNALADPSVQRLRRGPHDVRAGSVVGRRSEHFAALWGKEKRGEAVRSPSKPEGALRRSGPAHRRLRGKERREGVRVQVVRYCSQTWTIESTTPLMVWRRGSDIVVSGSRIDHWGKSRGL